MGINLKGVLKGLFGAAAALAAVIAGRVIGLYILSRAFGKAGLTAETYAFAPGYLRFLADNPDTPVGLAGYAFGITALMFLRDMFPARQGRLRAVYCLLPLAAAGTGFGLVKLLTALDEIRTFGTIEASAASEYIKLLFRGLFRGLFLYACLYEGFGEKLSLPVCGLFSAFLGCVMSGGVNVLPAVNGFLAGWLGARLYARTSSVLPGALIYWGFGCGSRLLAGYPGENVFSVSAGVWYGGADGLNASVLLALILAVCLLVTEVLHGKKTVVHCKSQGR